MNELPKIFLERLHQILTPEQLKQCLDTFSTTSITVFRVNTLKTSTPTLLDKLNTEGLVPSPVIGFSDVFYVPFSLKRKLSESDSFQEGLLYIQNLSSILAGLILSPLSGEEILDLAAAPGGKTLHIACLMQNQGRIAAVEAVRERFFRLKANVERAGASIVQCYHKDGRKVWHYVAGRFDRVLLDAPCSSEARFHLDKPDSFRYWSEKKISEMARKQKQLIYSAVKCLKPGGELVYSTCSFAPEENEEVIQYILDKFPGSFEIVPLDVPFENVQSGLLSWGKNRFSSDMRHAVRIIPNEWMSGFFICKLRQVSS